MLQTRDIAVLCSACRYYVLNRQQIQRLHFPADPDGRITRRRLQMLVEQKLLNRQQMLFCHPGSGTPAPVYYPTRKAAEFLAEHFEDARFLRVPAKPPIPHHTFHWLMVSDTHMAFDRAATAKDTVRIDEWINEYDELEPNEQSPDKKFRLYTLIREIPRLVCVPDAGFVIDAKGIRKAFYLECDRNTSGVAQIAASKTPGYAAMQEGRLHTRHFPSAVDAFVVLMVAPGDKRRNALRRAIHDKPGAHLWRFASAEDLARRIGLFDPIWYGCHHEQPTALVNAEAV